MLIDLDLRGIFLGKLLENGISPDWPDYNSLMLAFANQVPHGYSITMMCYFE